MQCPNFELFLDLGMNLEKIHRIEKYLVMAKTEW